MLTQRQTWKQLWAQTNTLICHTLALALPNCSDSNKVGDAHVSYRLGPPRAEALCTLWLTGMTRLTADKHLPFASATFVALQAHSLPTRTTGLPLGIVMYPPCALPPTNALVISGWGCTQPLQSCLLGARKPTTWAHLYFRQHVDWHPNPKI